MKQFVRFFSFSLSFLLIFSEALAQSAQEGEALYKSKCVTCHGAQGEGVKGEGAPRLRGQYDWYIVSSLEKFVSGERKNPKMAPYLKGLSREDFQSIAAYLSNLK